MPRNGVPSLFARFIIPAFIFGLLVAPLVHDPVLAAGDCAATVTSLDDSLTAGVWEHIMQFRASKGEARFEWSPNLAKAAAWMAKDSATRATTAGNTDSFGRDPRTRATDCGYRTDAQVATESQARVLTSDPYNVWMLWKQNDTSRMYPILYSPVMYPPTYTVGALGRYRDSAGLDYWVLQAGTLADTGASLAAPADPLASLAASYASSPPTSWTAGEQKTYSVTVTNTGTQTWNAGGANLVDFGVHFGTANDTPHNGWVTDQRFALPRDVPPGDAVTLNVTVRAPDAAGSYVLRHRMVKEQVAWFNQIQKTPVSVRP
jgi:hypothetical protein